MLIEVLLGLILVVKTIGLLLQWRESRIIAAMNRRTEKTQTKWSEYQKQRESELDNIRQEELRSLRAMLAQLEGMKIIAEGLPKEAPDA